MYWLALITFLGLVVGILIANFTREEVKSGKKYYIIAYKVVTFLLLILSLYYAWFVKISYFPIAFIGGIIFSFAVRNLYFYLGSLFLLSSWQNAEAFFNRIIILSFGIGLIRGALILNKFKKKTIIKKIAYALIAFIIPFVMTYFRSYVLGMDNVIFAFISGALFMEFIRKIDL